MWVSKSKHIPLLSLDSESINLNTLKQQHPIILFLCYVHSTLKNSVTSSLLLCSGVCLPASLALTGTWSKPTPAAFWPRGTCLINHAPVPMKGLVLLPAVDQSVVPRGPWQGLAYHPWSGPIHVSQTKMDSACHARMYHAWSLLHKLNMRSGGVLLK